MELKITKISNDWLLFKKEGGIYQKVGMIISKNPKSTIFLFDKSKAILSYKIIDDKYLINLTSEDYTLNSLFISGKQNSIKWKNSASKEFLECFSQPCYSIKVHKKKIAKMLPFSSDTYVLKIITGIDVPPLILLGSIFPLIK